MMVKPSWKYTEEQSEEYKIERAAVLEARRERRAQRARETRAKESPRQRVNKTPMTAEDKAERKRDARAAKALEAFNAREFVAWDGEGITLENGEHKYVLLAGMYREEYVELVRPGGIGTIEALNTILDFAKELPSTAIHVAYGAGYDINKMLKDLPARTHGRLADGQSVIWQGIRIEWRMGKYLRLSRVNGWTGKTEGKSVTLYDVVAFFQAPFVKACDSYLGDKFVARELVIENKGLRSAFRVEDLAEIRRYNQAELRNLILLMTELKDRLSAVGLRPAYWYGPGAIATALFKREDIKQYMAEPPDAVKLYAARAYFGGRFEMLRFGMMKGPIRQHDINSAYPAALVQVPSLAHGFWRDDSKWNGTVEPFGMYRVRWRIRYKGIPGPFPARDEKGNIYYPPLGETVVWSPELEAGVDYLKTIAPDGEEYGRLTVMDAKVFVPDDGAPKPFAFVQALYNERQERKAAGDGAQVAIKLALNSMYGKLAQQIGAKQDPETGEWRLPPYHQMEWAGYATSYCRALILRAITHAPERVIAIETDAIFLHDVRVPLPLSDKLGEWDVTEYKTLSYFQSGMYFGTKIDGQEVAKMRGVDRGQIIRKRVETLFASPAEEDRKIPATLTRFIGLKLARVTDMSSWGNWVTMAKQVALMPQGKRAHSRLCHCFKRETFPPRMAHITICSKGFVESSAFPVAWLNPDPEMSELTELRESSSQQWQFDSAIMEVG